MAKKCIPGMFCIENMTLALILFILLLILFLFYRVNDLGNKQVERRDSVVRDYVVRDSVMINRGNPDIFNDPHIPPLRTPDGFVFTAPVSVMTQPFDPQYRQVGILTRNSEILPLMGRRNQRSRDKWQYYTVTGGGNGNIQTKLPVSVKGKSCTGEYGCDEIYNNDTVYVEGYKDIFTATIYESSGFSYIP